MIASGIIQVVTFGHEPIAPTVCPALDPAAAIQIPSSLISVYQDKIDALINQLGKNVLLEFDPVRTPCPNCEYDAIQNRSRGIYKPGGPVPFARGRQCPYCKGDGFTEERETRCIKCLIKWQPRDLATYGIAVTDARGIVRTKGYLSDAALIVRANTALMNHDISGTLQFRCRRLRGPTPVGLREDRYCVTFWELAQNG